MINPSPLEKVFGFDEGSTSLFEEPTPNLNDRDKQLVVPITGEIIKRSLIPTETELATEERLEDLHIDTNLEMIHTQAISAFEKSYRMAEEVNPQFAARNAEVAAQYLTIALNTMNLRIDAKYKRQKVRINKEKDNIPTTVNNNMFIADRNDLIQSLFEKNHKQSEIIEGE